MGKWVESRGERLNSDEPVRLYLDLTIICISVRAGGFAVHISTYQELSRINFIRP